MKLTIDSSVGSIGYKDMMLKMDVGMMMMLKIDVKLDVGVKMDMKVVIGLRGLDFVAR